MTKLNNMINEYKGSRIPYSVLLSLEEWKSKRKEIIQRAHNTCEKCEKYCIEEWIPVPAGSATIYKPIIWEEFEYEGEIVDIYSGEIIDTYTKITFAPVIQSDPHFPQVHHTYYLANRFPWEYPNESLMLVCHKCHLKIHKEEIIKVYENESFTKYSELTPCGRCNGRGYLFEFDYYKNGICFGCNGACFEEWK